ncbi:MAG: hypothetical protein V4710_15425 [Verrucomicrobiota bacterium]
MRFKFAALYLVLLIPAFLFAAALWTVSVSGRLYYCWDSVPLLDFIPPFVHPGVMLNSRIHDRYIASPWLVWAIWPLFITAAFVLPVLVVRWLQRYLHEPALHPTKLT